MASRRAPSVAKILALSVPERILAVEQIWDSIAAKPSLVPVTAEQRTELERRLEAFDAEPGVGSSWAAVRRRIEKRSRK